MTREGDMLVTGREPGFYRLRYAAGHDFAAVNVDGREGDFAKLNHGGVPRRVHGRRPGARRAARTRASARAAKRSRRVSASGGRCSLAALLLFAAESLLARRTKVVKMIG